ncbi:MAG TPA: mechanosensitive ion channel family protein [Acidimicrobiia bacterium]|nr:mechanosensitive ion channel family protein [Acidimicrobiia bacterium]
MVYAQEEAEEALESLSRLTPMDWLIAGGIILGGVILARLVSALLGRLLSRISTSPHASRLVARFGAYLIVVFAFVYALNSVNVPIAPLLGALGLIGIALAFAFQDILENFIAGLGMQLRRPMRPGDEVMTNDYEGVVRDITLRTVQMTTFDGETVYLPNAMVWKNPIVNTTDRPTRRTTLIVGVAYATDLDRAKSVLESATAAVEGVMAEPAPTARVLEFGESSIDFALHFWHRPQMAKVWQVRDEVARSVKRHLDAAGIEIPFPQRVLHHPRPPEGGPVG